MITSQTTCPAGYYCPAKTAHYEIYPCPIGKLGTTTGLTQLNSCTSCPATKYCDRRGLSTSTADCEDGYLCDAGSIYPTGISNNECAIGAYCINGVQTSCASGTYNSEKGSATANDCIPCEQGKYCPNVVGTKVNCPQGKTCAEGASSSSDAAKVADCPAGHYCPSGSFQGKKCVPGTYQDAAGSTSCKTCSANKTCDGIGLTSETACPSFRECPSGSIRGRRCEPGEYIASGSNTCVSCLSSKYCWPVPTTGNDNGEQGTCAQGFVCKSGSAFQKPFISLTSTTASSTYNGPAFPGYYSTDGQTNVACTAGNWQPSAFATACITCREGHYCSDTAISDLTNYKCSAGTYCGTGLTSDAGTTCPINKYCEEGSTFAQHCLDGYYNPSTGQSTCAECGDDYFCYQSGTAPTLTENRVACSTNNTSCENTGTLSREPNCQDGTHLSGTTCTICPNTEY